MNRKGGGWEYPPAMAKTVAYGHEPAQLRAGIDGLLADHVLAGRLANVSARLRSQNGTERAADLIAGAAR